MPARIVIVLDDREVGERSAEALRAAGYDAMTLPGSMAAVDALAGAVRIELLVTCLDHGLGKPNGVSLACMARLKRPGIKVLFVGDEALGHYAARLGLFMASPVEVPELVQAAMRLLDTDC